MNYEYHDNMIDAFAEYFKCQTQFEYNNSNFAGTNARKALSVIVNNAKALRTDLLNIQKAKPVKKRIQPEKPPD